MIALQKNKIRVIYVWNRENIKDIFTYYIERKNWIKNLGWEVYIPNCIVY